MYTVRVESKEDMLKIDFTKNEMTYILLWHQDKIDPERFFCVEKNMHSQPYHVTFDNDTRSDRVLDVGSIHALYRLFRMYASGELS